VRRSVSPGLRDPLWTPAGYFVTAPADCPSSGCCSPKGTRRAPGRRGSREAPPRQPVFPPARPRLGFRVVRFAVRLQQPPQSSKWPLRERQVQRFELPVEGYVVPVFVEAALARQPTRLQHVTYFTAPSQRLACLNSGKHLKTFRASAASVGG